MYFKNIFSWKKNTLGPVNWKYLKHNSYRMIVLFKIYLVLRKQNQSNRIFSLSDCNKTVRNFAI